jgi:hypothetical protein
MSDKDPCSPGSITSFNHARKRLSVDSTKILMAAFEHNPKPSSEMRTALGQKLGLSSRAVQIWFQNRRAKLKKLSTGHDSKFHYSSYSFDKNGTPSLNQVALAKQENSFQQKVMNIAPMPQFIPNRSSNSQEEKFTLPSLFTSDSLPYIGSSDVLFFDPVVAGPFSKHETSTDMFRNNSMKTKDFDDRENSDAYFSSEQITMLEESLNIDSPSGIAWDMDF